MANQAQQIGRALSAFSAGLQGRGGEFFAQEQAQQAMQQKMDLERQKTVFTDSLSALNFAKQGRFDLVAQLGQNRLEMSQNFPGADFSDTQMLTEIAGMAAQGDTEAQQRLIDTLENNVEIGRGLGIIEAPDEKFSATTVYLPGGLTVQTTSTGRKVVSDAQENVLEGQAADQAIKEAEELDVARQRERSKAREEGKGQAQRVDDLINRGVSAAESTATIRRALTLLDRVETGGIDSISLAIKSRLGIEGADEGELSNSLGKSVLSQLRETFGAAFTENEGKRLERIEASFGKSPATNKRLLQQALRVAENTAKRAAKAANKRGETDVVTDINDLLEFSLDIDEPQPASAQAAPPTVAPQTPPAMGGFKILSVK